jgi:hypothetical protein
VIHVNLSCRSELGSLMNCLIGQNHLMNCCHVQLLQWKSEITFTNRTKLSRWIGDFLPTLWQRNCLFISIYSMSVTQMDLVISTAIDQGYAETSTSLDCVGSPQQYTMGNWYNHRIGQFVCHFTSCPISYVRPNSRGAVLDEFARSSSSGTPSRLSAPTSYLPGVKCAKIRNGPNNGKRSPVVRDVLASPPGPIEAV